MGRVRAGGWDAVPVARQSGQARERGPLGAEWYLSVLLVAAVLLDVLVFAVSALGGTLGPLVSIGAVSVGPLVAVALWWRTDGSGPRSAWVMVVLGGMGVLWLMAAARTVSDGRSASLSALLLPVLVLLAWGKPPTPAAALRAARVLAWALAVVAAVTLLLEAVGAVPSWYVLEGVDQWDWIEGDRAAYWLPLADLMGLDARWAGPFNHPNVAGMVGAVLVVLGAASRGSTRWVVGSVGIVVLLTTASRTSIVAAMGGICVLLAGWWLGRPSRLPRVARVLVAVAPVLIVLVLWVATNPGLTGRTSIWPVYSGLWGESPWIGVGQGGIDAAIEAGRLPDWAHHGHSLVLDTAARFGLLGLVVLGAVLAAGLVTVIGAARRGHVLGLALIVMILIAGLTETTLRWLYLTVPVATLILAVLMSAPTGSREPAGPRPTPGGRGHED